MVQISQQTLFYLMEIYLQSLGFHEPDETNYDVLIYENDGVTLLRCEIRNLPQDTSSTHLHFVSTC